MSIRNFLPLAFAAALPGCGVAGAAVDLATMPVRSVGRAVEAGSTVIDVATTSQSEKDQKRGREMRHREERMGSLGRDYDKQMRKCQDGNRKACRKADELASEMRGLMPGLPYEPEDE